MPGRGVQIILVASILAFVADLATQRALLEWGAKTTGIWSGEIYRLFAATFLHADLRHLVLNMFALLMFGRVVESILGFTRFIVVYLLSGAVGYMLSLLAAPETTAIGASAAIFGLMGYTLHYRLRRLPLRYLDIDTALLQILGLNLVFGFLMPRIDQVAHLGGLVGGVLTASLAGMPTPERRERSWRGEKLIAAVCLLLISWLSMQPLAAAERLRSTVPAVARWIDTRYGRYFSHLWADGITLLWMPAQAATGWNPAPETLRLASGQLARLAAFWRWEKGAGPARSVPYSVVWEQITADGFRRLLQEDRHTALKPDTDETLIFGRSAIVVGAGTYAVHVIVDGREVWQSAVQISN